MTEQQAPAGQTQPTNVQQPQQKKKFWKKPGQQSQSQPAQPTQQPAQQK